MGSITETATMADVALDVTISLPRFEGGFVDLQEVIRSLAESIVNEIMSAEPTSSAEPRATAGTAAATASS